MSELRQYIRDKKGRPTGFLLAVKSDIPANKFHIGWCQTHKGVDRFSKKTAVTLSYARIEKAKAKNLIVLDSNMPFSVKAALGDPDAPYSFYNRCIRYFK